MELTSWFTIKELTQMNSATIIWKAINMRTPKKLADSLELDSTTQNITVRETRIAFTKASFNYRARTDWNAIPTHIR